MADAAQKRINKILDHPEWSITLKISKLQTMALRAFPSSPTQKEIVATYKQLQEGKAPSDIRFA
jgi:hypothetical protein